MVEVVKVVALLLLLLMPLFDGCSCCCSAGNLCNVRCLWWDEGAGVGVMEELYWPHEGVMNAHIDILDALFGVLVVLPYRAVYLPPSGVIEEPHEAAPEYLI